MTPKRQSTFMIPIVVLMLIVTTVNAFTQQAVAVKGKLMCGTQPAANVRIKLCDPWQAIAMVQRLRSRGVPVEEFTFSQPSVGRLAVALHNGPGSSPVPSR